MVKRHRFKRAIIALISIIALSGITSITTSANSISRNTNVNTQTTYTRNNTPISNIHNISGNIHIENEATIPKNTLDNSDWQWLKNVTSSPKSNWSYSNNGNDLIIDE